MLRGVAAMRANVAAAEKRGQGREDECRRQLIGELAETQFWLLLARTQRAIASDPQES